MGSGLLLVRKEILESGEMRPYFLAAADRSSQRRGTEFSSSLSDRFTPGTPDVASAVGLEAACNYLSALGWKQCWSMIRIWWLTLWSNCSRFQKLSWSVRLGWLWQPASSDWFCRLLYKGACHDVAQVLDSEESRFAPGITALCRCMFATMVATTRASFQVYNTREEIDALVSALIKLSGF